MDSDSAREVNALLEARGVFNEVWFIIYLLFKPELLGIKSCAPSWLIAAHFAPARWRPGRVAHNEWIQSIEWKQGGRFSLSAGRASQAASSRRQSGRRTIMGGPPKWAFRANSGSVCCCSGGQEIISFVAWAAPGGQVDGCR